MATFLSRTASYAALSRFKSSPDFSTQHRQGRWHTGILPHAFSSHANRLLRKGVSDQERSGEQVGWGRGRRRGGTLRMQLQMTSVCWGSRDKSQLLKFSTGHMIMVSHSIYWSLNFPSVNILCRQTICDRLEVLLGVHIFFPQLQDPVLQSYDKFMKA